MSMSTTSAHTSTNTGNYSSTARWTAAARALESAHEDRLFDDPWALLLAGEEGAAWVVEYEYIYMIMAIGKPLQASNLSLVPGYIQHNISAVRDWQSPKFRQKGKDLANLSQDMCFAVSVNTI
jgi:hypothetical protein